MTGFNSSSLPTNPHKAIVEATILLRDNDNLLRGIFFNVFKHHHPALAAKVDVIYALSQAWCTSRSQIDFEMLEKYVSSLKPEEFILVASAFSHMLNLHNLTEQVNTAQTERAVRLGELESPINSTSRSFLKLVHEKHISPEQIYEAISSQQVELVLTAHPTQALRTSLLKKYSAIRLQVADLHNKRMSSFERDECLESIRGCIEAAWRTDEIHRTKPTPQGEMRHGLSYFQQFIFEVVPVFHRRVDTALASIGQPRIPLTHSLFKFGSWMGGDRDGNPNVTAQTTRDVVVIARLEAANLYFSGVESLMFELSVWRCSPELREYAACIRAKEEQNNLTRIKEERKRRNYVDFWAPPPLTEPYRVVLAQMRDRLWNTREVLHRCLMNPHMSVAQALSEHDVYSNTEDLFEPLRVMYDSLISTGDEVIANHKLLDFMRQVRTFGLATMTLDIRQESSRHAEVIDAMTRHLGLGSYIEWDEEKRLAFMVRELQGRRPLMPRDMDMSEEVHEVIKTFRMLAELPNDSLGAYIISMTRTASDVLAVVMLQRECGVRNFLRVVPLFETLDDLHNAPGTIRTLLSNEWYAKHINGHQECMIGYSDSGKDAGRLAAAWALFETQEKLAAVAAEFNVKLTLFHGRGGSVGRGGGPTHLAIRSQPPGTIKGHMRVTVQGEIIEHQFGDREVAFRTLDVYTSAMLEADLDPPAPPKQEWRDAMNDLSKVSCSLYRTLVFQDPRFFDYFQSATPAGELGRLNIGSRPSSRRSGGIETLRAIPWIFAWTQTRLNLPVWLGVGEALRDLIEGGKLDLLRDMCDHWTFFQTTLDLVEMVLAKTDNQIAGIYDTTLVKPDLWDMGEELRKRSSETGSTVLQVLRKHTLLEGGARIHSHSQLDEKLKLRAPYMAPLNILQALSLKALREYNTEGTCPDYMPEDPEVRDLLARDPNKDPHQQPFIAAMYDALMITIKGIASGMQNTG